MNPLIPRYVDFTELTIILGGFKKIKLAFSQNDKNGVKCFKKNKKKNKENN